MVVRSRDPATESRGPQGWCEPTTALQGGGSSPPPAHPETSRVRISLRTPCLALPTPPQPPAGRGRVDTHNEPVARATLFLSPFSQHYMREDPGGTHMARLGRGHCPPSWGDFASYGKKNVSPDQIKLFKIRWVLGLVNSVTE